MDLLGMNRNFVGKLCALLAATTTLVSASLGQSFDLSWLANGTLSTSSDSNLSASSLGRNTVNSVVDASYFSSSGWSTGYADPTDSSTGYVQLTLNALNGYTLDLTSISFVDNASTFGPTVTDFYVLADGNGFDNDTSQWQTGSPGIGQDNFFATWDPSTTTSHSWTLDGTSTPSLSGVQSVNLRWYGSYSGGTASDTWGLKDLRVTGQLNPGANVAPEPNTSSLVLLAGLPCLVIGVTRRVKKTSQKAEQVLP